MNEFRDRRTSVSSFKSNSSGGSRRNSAEQMRRISLSMHDQQKLDQSTESILVIEDSQNSFVESKFCRTGSVQYRNAGWKSSHKRNDSTSSSRSNASGKQPTGMTQSNRIIVSQKRSMEEQKAYINQRFGEIASILKASGVDEDILRKIRSTV